LGFALSTSVTVAADALKSKKEARALALRSQVRWLAVMSNPACGS
jgi:hypothetical protein